MHFSQHKSPMNKIVPVLKNQTNSDKNLLNVKLLGQYKWFGFKKTHRVKVIERPLRFAGVKNVKLQKVIRVDIVTFLCFVDILVTIFISFHF
jgi:hypothetical protein